MTLSIEAEVCQKQFDIFLVHAKDDKEQAELFKEQLMTLVLGNGKQCSICMLDDIFWNNSIIGSFSEASNRSTYIFLFVTENYHKDIEATYQGNESIMTCINNKKKNNCLIPVITSRNVKKPAFTNSIKHINAYDSNSKYYFKTLKGLLELRIHEKETRIKEEVAKCKEELSREEICLKNWQNSTETNEEMLSSRRIKNNPPGSNNSDNASCNVKASEQPHDSQGSSQITVIQNIHYHGSNTSNASIEGPPIVQVTVNKDCNIQSGNNNIISTDEEHRQGTVFLRKASTPGNDSGIDSDEGGKERSDSNTSSVSSQGSKNESSMESLDSCNLQSSCERNRSQISDLNNVQFDYDATEAKRMDWEGYQNQPNLVSPQKAEKEVASPMQCDNDTVFYLNEKPLPTTPKDHKNDSLKFPYSSESMEKEGKNEFGNLHPESAVSFSNVSNTSSLPNGEKETDRDKAEQGVQNNCLRYSLETHYGSGNASFQSKRNEDQMVLATKSCINVGLPNTKGAPSVSRIMSCPNGASCKKAELKFKSPSFDGLKQCYANSRCSNGLNSLSSRFSTK